MVPLTTVLLVSVASHDQKRHVAHHFDHTDLREAMVPLMMLLASCDTIPVPDIT